MKSHTFFAAWNRTVNPVVERLVRVSPRGAGRRLALITVTGRKTGREYTFPVGYSRRGDQVEVVVGWPERKLWWRNLTGEGAPVRIEIEGTERRGHAVARGDEESGVTVEVALDRAAAPRT